MHTSGLPDAGTVEDRRKAERRHRQPGPHTPELLARKPAGLLVVRVSVNKQNADQWRGLGRPTEAMRASQESGCVRRVPNRNLALLALFSRLEEVCQGFSIPKQVDFKHPFADFGLLPRMAELVDDPLKVGEVNRRRPPKISLVQSDLIQWAEARIPVKHGRLELVSAPSPGADEARCLCVPVLTLRHSCGDHSKVDEGFLALGGRCIVAIQQVCVSLKHDFLLLCCLLLAQSTPARRETFSRKAC